MFFVKSKNKTTISKKEEIEAAIEHVLKTCSDVVTTTMGPGGRPVLLDRVDSAPLTTKDGVTVLKYMGFGTATENVILDTAKEISINTGKTAGDGTTTAILLAEKIYFNSKEFLKKNPKVSPQKFVRELEQCYKEVLLPSLASLKKETKTDEELFQVAKISANGDLEIATAVVDAISASGDDGTILINEDQGGSIRVSSVDGYICTTGYRELGYIGPKFITDAANQNTALNRCKVVLFDGSISDFVLFTAIQQAYDSDPENHGRPIIIVAHSFSDAVVEKCLVHTKRGLPIIPVKAPNSSLPNSKTIFLNDLAALSGAKINDPTTAAAFDITDFGESELFKMNNFETFFQFNSDSDAIDKRVNELKALLDTCFSEIDRSHVRANIAKISGGLSTIWVGGVTDAEIREKKDRVQDAIEAVRSAIAEGVVPGGGVTHIALSKAIEGAAGHKPSWKVLSDALVSPLAKILENCGESDIFDYVYDMVVKSSEGGRTPNVVYDAEMHELVNPFERGIIEPSKVLRVSIANSLSISSMLATLGGIIVNPSNPELEAQIEAASVAFKQTMGAAQED